MKLDTLTLKQTHFVEETVDDLSNCLTMIPNVRIVNTEMNRKQWVKFAVNINRSDKRLQSLGIVLYCIVFYPSCVQHLISWRSWRQSRAATWPELSPLWRG